MTRKRTDLPRRVYVRHGRHYLVTLAGKWEPLTRVQDGLAALWRAYAALVEQSATPDRMPAVVGRWLAEQEPGWAAKHAENQRHYGKVIAEAFADFAPRDVTTRDCNEFLLRSSGDVALFVAYAYKWWTCMRCGWQCAEMKSKPDSEAVCAEPR